jgi:hypothetical protein
MKKQAEKQTEIWPYEDIVNLPHHVSKKHPQMPMIKRAAQFAPFAALTGFDEVIRETARQHEIKMKQCSVFVDSDNI